MLDSELARPTRAQEADRFLMRMARLIVGTLVEVGRRGMGAKAKQASNLASKETNLQFGATPRLVEVGRQGVSEKSKTSSNPKQGPVAIARAQPHNPRKKSCSSTHKNRADSMRCV